MKRKLKITKRLGQRNDSESQKSYISKPGGDEPRNSVSEDSLKVWSELPAKIRQDPSLALFKTEHEKLHGKYRLRFMVVSFECDIKVHPEASVLLFVE